MKLLIFSIFALLLGIAGAAQPLYSMARSNYTQGNMSTTLRLVSETSTTETIQLYIDGGTPPYNVNITVQEKGNDTYQYHNVTNVTEENQYYTYVLDLASGVYNISSNVISGPAKMQSFSSFTLTEKHTVITVTNNQTTTATSTITQSTTSQTSQSSTTSMAKQNSTTTALATTTILQAGSNNGGILRAIEKFFSGIINAIMHL